MHFHFVCASQGKVIFTTQLLKKSEQCIFFSHCIFCHLNNFLNKSGECSRCDEFSILPNIFSWFVFEDCAFVLSEPPFHSSQRTEGRYACGGRNTVLAYNTPGPGLRTRLCAQCHNTERRRRLALDSYL